MWAAIAARWPSQISGSNLRAHSGAVGSARTARGRRARARPGERRCPPAGRRSRTASRSVLGLASLIGLVAILVPLLETVAVRKSQAAAAAGRYRAALGDAATAQRLEPGSATPWLQRALTFEQLNRPRPALAAVLQAETREPTNWRIWLIASRLATEAGRPGQALTDYRRARSLNPSSALFTETLRLIPIGGEALTALMGPPGRSPERTGLVPPPRTRGDP